MSAGGNMPWGDEAQEHRVVRFLIEIALWNKKQRVAWDKPNASVPTFGVAGQPVTLEPALGWVTDLRSLVFRSMATSLKLLPGFVSNLSCGIHVKLPNSTHGRGIALPIMRMRRNHHATSPLLTRALLGEAFERPPPPGFSRIAKIRRRATPPGFHPFYPPSFPQLLWKFRPKGM